MALLYILLYSILWSLHSKTISVLGAPTQDLTSASISHWALGNQEAESLLIKRQSNTDIFLALYFRGHLVDKQRRLAAKNEAFHWGLHLTPAGAEGKSTTLFHAINDGPKGDTDPHLFKYEKRLIDPLRQQWLHARIKLGTLPSTSSVDEVDRLLSELQVPNKYKNPSESCVTWGMCGIEKLQEKGVLERFDTKGFAEKVTQYGEQRVSALWTSDDSIDVTRQKIARYDLQQQTVILDPEPARAPRPDPSKLDSTTVLDC